MIRQKQHFLEKIRISAEELLAPLAAKPALVAALTLMATYGSLDAPDYAPLLLIPVALSVFAFPKSIKRVVLASLLVAAACHEAVPRIKDFLHEKNVAQTAQASIGTAAALNGTAAASNGTAPVSIGTAPPPDSVSPTGCGRIKALLPRSNGIAFLVNTEDANRQTRLLRITEKRELPLLPEPGDSICFEAQWYPVTPPTVPGAFDTEEWLRSQGFAAYGKFRHWNSWRGDWIPERSFFAFRKWIKSRFDEYLEPSETGLLLGLLAGDRSGIPEAIRNDFQRSGLVHVLAISGFHVVLLAGMLMTFLKATRLPYKVASVAAVILLFIYIPVTGGSAAVQRAVIMFAIPQLGTIFGRTANTLNSLGVALLFILIPEPAQLWNPGFQLSAAATAGILVGGKFNPLKHLPEALSSNKIWKALEASVVAPTYVTLCATLATAPFLIHHFRTLSPMAWLGNIVIVPAISWGMQAGLFALLSPLDILRECFCYSAGFFLRVASLLTRMLSDSAEASMTIGPFSPAILILMGIGFLTAPLFRKNSLARFYSIACILLFAGIFCWNSYSSIIFPKWELTLIDVGQGDSVLLTSPSGKHILVDSGDNSRIDNGKDVIVPFLHYTGILNLDALVITHTDQDHFGGASSILRTFPVKELWINECALSETKEEWQNVLEEAEDRHIPIKKITRGATWKEHYFEIQALHPKALPKKDSLHSNKCSDTNRESITLRAKGLGHSAMLTGDLTVEGEKEILQTEAYLKSDILKLGHHGSKTSSSPKFLEAVSPQVALISSGRKNKFRHPHKQVTNRLDSLGIPYLNTATSGTVNIVFTEDSLTIRTMLPSRHP